MLSLQLFSREEVPDGDEAGQTVIKMTNTKLGISTFWTMDKFEDKLLRMREMFQVRRPPKHCGCSHGIESMQIYSRCTVACGTMSIDVTSDQSKELHQ